VILKVQCVLAEQAGIDLTTIDPRLHQLRKKTDVQRLAAALDLELASVSDSSTQAQEPTVSALAHTKTESSEQRDGSRVI
jgi:hypothetical protein